MRVWFFLLSMSLSFFLNGDQIQNPTYGPFRVVLDPKEKTILSAELNAPVIKIHKRMGDTFEPGETLISLERQVVEANYRKANAKRNKAQIELEGKQKLFDQDLISLFELRDAEAAYADAQSEEITAEKYMNALDIKASYKGSVVKVAIEERELAQVGKELIEIIRDDKVLAHFLAPANLLTCLQVGKRVDLTFDGKNYKTTLTRVSPIIDAASSTIKVEAEIENDKRELTPGQIGKAWLICY